MRIDPCTAIVICFALLVFRSIFLIQHERARSDGGDGGSAHPHHSSSYGSMRGGLQTIDPLQPPQTASSSSLNGTLLVPPSIAVRTIIPQTSAPDPPVAQSFPPKPKASASSSSSSALHIDFNSFVQQSSGAIATLIIPSHLPLLLRRNRSLAKYLSSVNAYYELVIFHENWMTSSQEESLRQATPELMLRFINVSASFNAPHRYNTFGICGGDSSSNSGEEGSGSSPSNHRKMCRFWFKDFLSHLKDYHYMIRMDADCELTKPVVLNLLLSHNSFFAASYWVNLRSTRLEHHRIYPGFEGRYVTGLMNLTRAYLTSIDEDPDSLQSWSAPYTSVLFINLDWARGNAIIQGFMRLVEESGCQFSNRWSDLPLWGAALAVSNTPPVIMQFPYTHGGDSHDGKLVDPHNQKDIF